jgi:hypothetical protein
MTVLAHQGGWDEILLVLAPLSLFALLLYVANRRAERLVEQRRAERGDEPGDQQGDEPERGDHPPR